MFKSVMKYNKLKDIINIREPEVILSIACSTILCIVLYVLDVYDKFSLFIDTLGNILNCFVQGYQGIIGFALSGMAIMLGLFGKKQIENIEKINGKGVLEEIMSSYAFLALFSAMDLIILLILSFIITSDKQMMSEGWFWILAFCLIYLSLFGMFYAVALVFNCIKLFTIYKSYSKNETSVDLSLANEVRIDYLLRILTQICQFNREEVLKQLEEETSGISEEVREELKTYFEKHY